MIKNQGDLLIKPIKLFSLTFILISSIYLFVLGEDKTIEIVKDEYLFILSLISLYGIYLYFKFKLKNYEIVDFNKNTNLSFKTTVILFLIFQVVDYIQQDGFIGMISQWLLYWIMGLISLVLSSIMNVVLLCYFFSKNDPIRCIPNWEIPSVPTGPTS